METPTSQDGPLAEALSALGSPTRLALMRAVRAPRALREIEVGTTEEGKTRPLARQTVREHLDRLIEVGVVTTRPAAREYGETVEFLVNHQALFGISEEMRTLARLRPVVEPRAETIQRAAEAPQPPERPCLVLVKGLDEGTTFELRPGERKEWIVGRRRGIAVSLDFDPSISAENARITWVDGAHHIEDHPESRNGTTVNFRLVPKGESARLQHGDLVGVGRTLLLYWA